MIKPYPMFIAVLVLGFGLTAFAQENQQEKWQNEIQQRRAQAATHQATAGSNPPAQSAPQTSPPSTGKDEGQIILNGKVITTRRINPAPAQQTTPSNAPARVQSATGSVSEGSATAPAPAPAPPAPEPTPAMVKIKKTKIVGGKILTVEVEVTPTPGPATEAPPEAATGEQTAQPSVPSATGYMLEVMQKLEAATKTPNKSMRFDAKMIAKLREEFMKHKDLPHALKIAAPTEAIKIQSDLQRLSSIARGGNIEKETAEKLLKILFPPPAPKAEANQGIVITGGNQLEEMKRQETESQQTTEGESPAQQVDEPQIYVDPETGQYYYEDGTPVGAEQEEPQGQYYYDDAGNLYYEVGGQVYYVQDGEFYLLEN